VAVTHTAILTTQQSCINLQHGNCAFRTIRRTSSDHFLEEHNRFAVVMATLYFLLKESEFPNIIHTNFTKKGRNDTRVKGEGMKEKKMREFRLT